MQEDTIYSGEPKSWKPRKAMRDEKGPFNSHLVDSHIGSSQNRDQMDIKLNDLNGLFDSGVWNNPWREMPSLGHIESFTCGKFEKRRHHPCFVMLCRDWTMCEKSLFLTLTFRRYGQRCSSHWLLPSDLQTVAWHLATLCNSQKFLQKDNLLPLSQIDMQQRSTKQSMMIWMIYILLYI